MIHPLVVGGIPVGKAIHKHKVHPLGFGILPGQVFGVLNHLPFEQGNKQVIPRNFGVVGINAQKRPGLARGLLGDLDHKFFGRTSRLHPHDQHIFPKNQDPGRATGPYQLHLIFVGLHQVQGRGIIPFRH